MLIERGGQGLWSQTEVDACKADVRALMGHLGILDESRENQKQQEIVEASYVELTLTVSGTRWQRRIKSFVWERFLGVWNL